MDTFPPVTLTLTQWPSDPVTQWPWHTNITYSVDFLGKCFQNSELYRQTHGQMWLTERIRTTHVQKIINSLVMTVAARSRLRSAVHGDIVVPRAQSTRCGCLSCHVCAPIIWNKLPQDLRITDTSEQFKRSVLKGWLFECAYGRRRVWYTLTEGAPYKRTYLLTYCCTMFVWAQES